MRALAPDGLVRSPANYLGDSFQSTTKRGTLVQAIQSLKQSVARRLALRAPGPFWQARYYDFNLWSERKFVEKLRYIHRNPLTRGLVVRPEDWAWSSFRHYLSGEPGSVEIESRWTARKSKPESFRQCGRGHLQKIPAQAELGRGTLRRMDRGSRPGHPPHATWQRRYL